MAKHRTGDPWMPSAEYGRGLPPFTANLFVREIPRSVRFYQDVLGARVLYHDSDFAALEACGVGLMLHADHTLETHPWTGRLPAEGPRGAGVELRLFGLDPDRVAERAASAGVPLLEPVRDRAHGWRETTLADPDGYLWAVGVPIPPAP